MLHDILTLFFTDIDAAMLAAAPYVNDLLYALLTLEIAFFGIEIAFGKSASIGAILERVLMMGTMVLIVRNFPYWSELFAQSLTKILGLISPQVNVSHFANSPGDIVTWGDTYIVNVYTKAINSITGSGNGILADLKGVFDMRALGMELEGTLVELLFDLIFVILAVQMALAQIEFHLMILFAMIILPFIAWKPVRFLGTRAFGAVIGQAIKVGIITFIITLGIAILGTLVSMPSNKDFFHPDGQTVLFPNVLALLGACSLLLFLSLQAPSLATSLLTGSPAFNAATYAQNMGLGMIVGGLAGGLRGLTRSSGNSQSPGAPSPNSGSSGSAPTRQQSAPPSSPSVSYTVGSQFIPTQAATGSVSGSTGGAPSGIESGRAPERPQVTVRQGAANISEKPVPAPAKEPAAAAVQSSFFLNKN